MPDFRTRPPRWGEWGGRGAAGRHSRRCAQMARHPQHRSGARQRTPLSSDPGPVPSAARVSATPRRHRLAALTLLFLALLAVQGFGVTVGEIKARGVLRWGGDAEGGGPYIFPDPDKPERLIGFEVDLAEAIAREMGVKAQHCQNAWDSLLPALLRRDFDLVINGIEITGQKAGLVGFSKPYYVFTEQLVVRKDEQGLTTLKDLKGKKVGTLSGALAQGILTKEDGIDVRTYSGQAEPYEDLALGRLDAVLLDLPIAAYYALPNPALKYAGEAMGKGYYGIALHPQDTDLKTAVDEILGRMLLSGELQRIYDKWHLWNAFQAELTPLFASGSKGVELEKSQNAPMLSYLPLLLKGAGLTIFISTVSMFLAVALGVVLAVMKVYSRSALKFAATAYIEIYRGTPLLIQLYILYYGLPNVGISLTPMWAAFIGLGMNYAAYEAELYRAGISAIPKGQMEAALSLGMTEWMAIRRIILPQAFRIALPGITNDFIALFKDSSLVSVIAMVELTKTYNMVAASTLRFFDFGILVGLMYFAMSYPLSLLARRLEAKLEGKKA